MNIPIINRDPEILGGTPIFAGTRVPIRILLENFEAGERLDDFLLDYPSVSREQVTGILKLMIGTLDSVNDEAVT